MPICFVCHSNQQMCIHFLEYRNIVDPFMAPGVLGFFINSHTSTYVCIYRRQRRCTIKEVSVQSASSYNCFYFFWIGELELPLLHELQRFIRTHPCERFSTRRQLVYSWARFFNIQKCTNGRQPCIRRLSCCTANETVLASHAATFGKHILYAIVLTAHSKNSAVVQN